MFTPEQQAKIQHKDAVTPDALKRDPFAHYCEGYFHVTLCVKDKAPLLGQMGGRPEVKEGADAPHVVPTAVGQAVIKSWEANARFYPCAEFLAFQLMPEHVHGLIHLKPGNTKHLGQIVRGFMIGCTHGYWDTLGLPWREQTYVKGVRTPQYNDRDHTRSFRGPSLFVRGYNDVQALSPEQVQIKIDYIRSNPLRRLIKAARPDIFRIVRNQTSANWTPERIRRGLLADGFFSRNPQAAIEVLQTVATRLSLSQGTDPLAPDARLALDYIGSRSLLLAPRKVSLICHRADVSLFERQAQDVREAARNGAVVVSAFISPRERDIKKQLLEEKRPIIEIMDNGFSLRYKPCGLNFNACGEERLLQLSPWNYLFQREAVVSRAMCLTMNELVRLVSGQPDDWWKQTL